MRRSLFSLRSARWACLAALLLLTHGQHAVAASGQPASDTALAFMPDDVAFYSSSLRLSERAQIVAQSNAWKKLTQLPVVQMGLGLYQLQAAMPDTPVARVNAVLVDPQWEDTRQLVRDMFSQEVFCCGDKNLIGALKLMRDLQNAMRFGPALARLSNPNLPGGDTSLQAKLALATLAARADEIKIPNLLMGFRISNKQRAQSELDRLEKLAQAIFAAVPQLSGRLQRTKVGPGQYLTLNLDGKMLPWELLPQDSLKQYEANPGDAQKLLDQLKNLKLVVAVGVRENYLLLSIGASTAPLAKLGGGKLLTSRPELAPLAKFADRRLIEVSYLSSALAAAAADPKAQVRGLLQVLDQALPAAQLSAEQQKQLRADAAKLVDELTQLMPAPGGASGFGFLTSTGVEGFGYNWGGRPGREASKPLTLLGHVGGTPLAAVVFAAASPLPTYEVLAKWAPIALRHAEQIALEKEPKAEQKEKFKQAAALLRKEGAELDKITRTLLFPALADGQAALALDGKFRSKQFCQHMPASEQPLAIVEPAVVVGVSDREKLRAAAIGYAGVVDDFWAGFRTIAKEELPEFKIPTPKSVVTKAGEMVYYPLPGAWGLDKQFLPNVTLGEHVVALSTSRKHSERLLATASWTGVALPASPSRPLLAAGVCRPADAVDAFAPWIDYLAKIVIEKNPQLGQNQAQVKYVMDQVHTLLDVLKTFKSASFEVYTEGKAVVRHWQSEYQDSK